MQRNVESLRGKKLLKVCFWFVPFSSGQKENFSHQHVCPYRKSFFPNFFFFFFLNFSSLFFIYQTGRVEVLNASAHFYSFFPVKTTWSCCAGFKLCFSVDHWSDLICPLHFKYEASDVLHLKIPACPLTQRSAAQRSSCWTPGNWKVQSFGGVFNRLSFRLVNHCTVFSVRSEGVCWESLCWSLLFCSAFVILSRQTQSCINWRDILWPTTVRNIGSYCPRLLMKSYCFSSSCSTHLEADYWRWWYFLQNDSACSIFSRS